MLLSYVFSFRNEQDNIPELVGRVDKVSKSIEDCSYEMIFVNDDSTDDSVEILLELQKEYPITIVNMSRRFGVTPCVLAGLAQASGEAVVYMDSDLQDPPELVYDMVAKYRDGAEVVHTTRTSRAGESAFKMWVTKKAYRIINYFSDVELPENTGDFKLLSAKVVEKILNLPEYEPYMRGLSVWIGFKQAFVEYNREPRFSGKTKFPLLSRGPVNEFIRGLTAYSAVPLYLSFILGFITSVTSVGLILWALLIKFLGIATPGSSGVLIAIAFFSGVILMTNGIIGLYIAKIYYEVKGRPRYIIKSIIKPNQTD